ncbi:phage protein [mine drainage metagenome]|uniref:Phage protein n=1 Tax=mine drainage metagenome TaxID=410659 RepID=A0A1J5SED2_9ZZZZ
MTACSDSTKKCKKTKRISALKSPRRYIDPEDFYLMRHRAFLNIQQTSELLDVTQKTVQNWEKGRTRIPYTAYRVLKIKVGYVFDDNYFDEWFVRGDTLWSPEGRGFKPHELRYISNYFWMARRWLAERKAAKDLERLKASIERGAASDGSPTLRAGTLPSCGAAPLQNIPQELVLPLSLQEKPRGFEKFLRELGLTA